MEKGEDLDKMGLDSKDLCEFMLIPNSFYVVSLSCYCYLSSSLLTFLFCQEPRSNDSAGAMNPPSTQILVSKYI